MQYEEITLELDIDLINKLITQAKEEGITVNCLVIKILLNDLKQHGYDIDKIIENI